jgi:hypothetical protein
MSNNEIIKQRRLSITAHCTDVLGPCTPSQLCKTPTARVEEMSLLKG